MIVKLVRRFSRDERGATATEYAMIALVVGVGIVAGLQQIPPALNGIWNNVVSYLK